MGQFLDVFIADKTITVIVDQMEVGVNVHWVLCVSIGVLNSFLQFLETYDIFRIVFVFAFASDCIASELIFVTSLYLFQGQG